MTTKRLARLLVSTLVLGAALAVLAGPTLANGHDRGVVGKQTLLAAAATYLGVTQADISTARKAGQSLAQLAAAKGKSVQGLTDALVAAGNAAIDKAQAAGTITADQATAKRATLPAQVQALINATGAGHCSGSASATSSHSSAFRRR